MTKKIKKYSSEPIKEATAAVDRLNLALRQLAKELEEEKKKAV